ncbi:protease SohB [Candidatus Rariloculus sp.]|uniref:protease SohB n=1 Tax=Candidatus Rariloculus sp. TaxID=3101265 RepID=UPI003D0FCB18
MVAEFLSEFGLFLLELVTVLAFVLIVIVVITVSARRTGQPEGITVRHLNKQYEDAANTIKRAVLGKNAFKKELKSRRKLRKKRKGGKDEERNRIFVLDFKGDIRASATASLRQEISALLAVARDSDQVLLRLENAGGTVHEHGLAASQLLRIKRRGLRLLIAVDKVAASGGYLMACVADRLMSAPFAIIGSIGVLAQLPNFRRLLEDKGIDFEQVTAGKHKRTLTLFGENTAEGRSKLKEELEDIHELFKNEISEHRPQVELDRVATGEHWYGTRALELKLIDEIRTSDDFLAEATEANDLYQITFKRRRTFPERLRAGAETLLSG